MKKLILILLTAIMAVAGCGAAACSKGQTGGGNNTLSGYSRSEEGYGTEYDCGCGEGCDCKGKCGEDCDCKDDCDCEGEKDDARHRRMPHGRHADNMDDFEFERGGHDGLPEKRHGMFGMFAPEGSFKRRKPMPLPPHENDQKDEQPAEQSDGQSGAAKSGDESGDKSESRPDGKKDDKKDRRGIIKRDRRLKNKTKTA